MTFAGAEFLTVQEVADILKVNQQTVRNWIDAGKLPHVRLGSRRIRIFRSDLDALISSGYGLPGKRGRPPAPTRAQGFWSGEYIPEAVLPPEPESVLQPESVSEPESVPEPESKAEPESVPESEAVPEPE